MFPDTQFGLSAALLLPWVSASIFIIALVAFGMAIVRNRCYRQVTRNVLKERNQRLACEQLRALAEARLALLMGQFDPDFLSNNLASLQFLMKRDPARAGFMLSQRVQYLRLSIPSLRNDVCTLGAQMDMADAYLQLASMRMGKRLFVLVSCPPELKNVPFSPMLIHALVENALLHGVQPCLTPVMVSVRAYVMLDRLVVDVEDDGVGLGRNTSIGNSGRGLQNIRTRLDKDYGRAAKLTVVQQTARGVLSRIEILQSESGNPGELFPNDHTVNQ